TAVTGDGIDQVIAALRAAINADTATNHYVAFDDTATDSLTVLNDTKAGFTLLSQRGTAAVVSGTSQWAHTEQFSGTVVVGELYSVSIVPTTGSPVIPVNFSYRALTTSVTDLLGAFATGLTGSGYTATA